MDDTTRTLIERLAVIETKLDMFLSSQEAHHADHEARIRRLERWKLLSMGAAAAVGGAAGKIVPMIGG